MKLVYGLLLSYLPKQAERLVDLLNVNDNTLIIFIDKKSTELYKDFVNKYSNNKNIYFIENTFDTYWGHISETQAIFDIMKESLKYEYDYFILLSETCLPLYSDEYIKEFLSKHNGSEFFDFKYDWTKRSRLHLIHDKPYTAKQRKHRNILAFRDVVVDTLCPFFAKTDKQFKSYKIPTSSTWFTCTKRLLNEMVLEIEKDNTLDKYKNTLMQDEHIFIDTVIHSRFYSKLYRYNKKYSSLMYIDWKTLNAPKTLIIKDAKKIYKSNKLFARKIDDRIDSSISKYILDKIKTN